jgi:folate-binding Fe-S cluster repair protein YgfZ
MAPLAKFLERSVKQENTADLSRESLHIWQEAQNATGSFPSIHDAASAAWLPQSRRSHATIA